MEVSWDLEVDVNGEEIFFVNKEIIVAYSGKFRKFFKKPGASIANLKVIFNDFPGGAETFELVTRFCYNYGEITITPSNIISLHRAAKFMEMKDRVSETPSLLEKTEKSMEEMGYFSWSELLFVLKQCQDLDPLSTSDSSTLTNRILESLVTKLSSPVELSPCASTSSQESSGVRLSCDSKSTESVKNSFGRATWWFEDLVALSPGLLETVVKSMLSRKIDHSLISKFLFYYQKTRLSTASSDEKRKILETVIDMLHKLDPSCVSCKSLFGVLRVCLGMDIKRGSRTKLEMMIGFRLDRATLDNLLIPSPYGSNYLYDINLVLRFLKGFFSGKGGRTTPDAGLKKVANLMDLYTAEVAPDPCVKPSKFLTLIMILPESARDSHDEIYRAIDMYLEVHTGISEADRSKICMALNHGKLSAETFDHLSRNPKFPSGNSIQALRSQQMKLRSLIQTRKKSSESLPDGDSPCGVDQIGHRDKDSVHGKLHIEADNENLRSQLQGIQWRVLELERACKNMHTQMVKIMKSSRSNNSARPLPRLCS